MNRPWAILTAHNPGAVRHEPHQNERRQLELERRLSGFYCLSGINGEGDWAEASLIVAALPLDAALELGRDFGQVAVLWGTGQRAALVWCGPEQTDRPTQIERFWVSAFPSPVTETQ